jgi:uncharacterized damage-inducible protein DinB
MLMQSMTASVDQQSLREITELYAYNAWANQRVLGAVARLSADDFGRDLKNSFPSVRDTLAHILGGEWVWLSRWKGKSPTSFPVEWDVSTHAQLIERWQPVAADQRAFLDALTPESLNKPITYTTFAGQAFTNPLWQLMRHVANHSTYHRGQVTTMLRQLGAATVSTDLILFYREAGGMNHIA